MTRRVLSIDGGGIRGVFSAAVIEQMEKEAGVESASEIFDCFVGTSAGSILAAGLAAGIPAGTLKRIFIELGHGMAQAMSAGGGGSDAPADPAAVKQAREHASQMLAGLLQEKVFKGENGELKANDLKKRFAVVTRNMEAGKVVFFGNFPEDQLETPSFWDDVIDPKTEKPIDEHDDPVWRMVLRSAALPPFFAPDGPYLDGGVSPFANPCYAAYVGVQRRLGWNPYEEPLRFYSVGTGYHSAPQPLEGLDDTKLFAAMVDAMMQDINFLQHQVMKRQRDEGTIWYKRYNISFDRKGMERYGLQVTDEELAELAGTASFNVEKLAEIGTAVGRALVQPEDFLEGEPLPDRRKTSTEKPPTPDRRILRAVQSHPADPRVEGTAH
jgi:hypothetical protein